MGCHVIDMLTRIILLKEEDALQTQRVKVVGPVLIMESPISIISSCQLLQYSNA